MVEVLSASPARAQQLAQVLMVTSEQQQQQLAFQQQQQQEQQSISRVRILHELQKQYTAPAPAPTAVDFATRRAELTAKFQALQAKMAARQAAFQRLQARIALCSLLNNSVGAGVGVGPMHAEPAAMPMAPQQVKDDDVQHHLIDVHQ